MSSSSSSSSLVNFDQGYKLSNLKEPFYFSGELSSAYNKLGVPGYKVSSNITSWTNNYRTFVNKIVEEVKQVNRTTKENQCSINIIKLYDTGLSSQYFLIAVAKALYRDFGIAVVQVDSLEEANTMVVSWNRDNPLFTTSLEYMQQARKDKYLTDYQLRLGDKTYPVHKLVLSARSPYFDKLFRGGFKEQNQAEIIADVKPAELELFLDYIYTGRIELKGLPAESLAHLMELAIYYHCDHVKQKCVEQMCKDVTLENYANFIQIAREFAIEKLEEALVQHVKNEIVLDNLESFVLLARQLNVAGLEELAFQKIGEKLVSSSRGGSHQFEAIKEYLELAKNYKQEKLVTELDEGLTAAVKTRAGHKMYNLETEMIRQYLEIATQLQLVSLQAECQAILMARLEEERPSLDEIKLILKAATQQELKALLDACETHLIKRLEEDREKILVLASTFQLSQLLEAGLAAKGQ